MNKLYFIIFLLFSSPHFSQSIFQNNKELQKVNQYIQKENYVQGISTLEKLLNQNPNDTDIYRTYAILLLKINNLEEALEKINKAILLSQKNATNHMIAGNIYRELNDYSNATKAYETSIKLDPGLAENYYEYAYLNLKQHKIQEAERLLKLSQSFDNSAWQNSILKAKIAQYKNNIKETQSIFFNAINQFPNEENILNEFAQFYLEEGQDQKALALLKKANILFGNSIYRNDKIGQILFKNKSYQEALKYYKLSENSYKPIAFSGVADLHWRLYFLYLINNKTDLALTHLKTAFELSPLNQFYIMEYANYLIKNTPPTAPQREILANYIEKLAQQERKKGINFYYLSLLQKVIALSPFNISARDKLLDYAQLTKNEYQINHLLKEIAQHSPPNASVNNIIKLRQHLSQTKQLDQTQIPFYQYTNLVFIQHPIAYIAQSISTEIQALEHFTPNIHSIFELQKPFEQESQFIFHNNSNYNIITHITINTLLSFFNIIIYDKKGMAITNFKIPYSTKHFTEELIHYTQLISNILPTIGFITSRLPNSVFRTTLGSYVHLSNNMRLVVLDQDFKPITTLKITKINSAYSFAKLYGEIPNNYFDFQGAYVIPIQYVPSLYTNTNKNYLDITRVSQKKLSSKLSIN